MKINITEGMVNISTPLFEYANIQGMYIGGNGAGIQIDPSIKEVEGKVSELCDLIANSIYQLKELQRQSKTKEATNE